MSRFLTLLTRGITLRCPVCGRGHLFSSPFRMNKNCPACQFKFEREEGYYTSSMALNLIVSEVITAAVVLPLAANPNVPILPALLFGIPLAIILPALLFHHTRGIWLCMDHYLNPAPSSDIPDQSFLIPRPRGLNDEG
jgi:uncharacterized protein (DUF983 family)